MRLRFWSAQPVFHVYDIKYYLFYSGIINTEFPEKNRYTNFIHIETLTFGKNIKPLHESRFIQILKRHYLQNGDNQFCPEKTNVIPYFEGHNSPCFLSFYKDPELLQDIKSGQMIETEKIVGVMTTRPMHVTIRNRGSSVKKGTTTQFDAYYVDYLCVDKQQRKKGIAPQIIQTHHYNQRLLNKDIQVSFFKREGQLTGIVPICVYQMHVFSIRKWNKPANIVPPFSVVECGTSNIHHLYDFLRSTGAEKMDLSIITELTNLIALMKSKNIRIHLLLNESGVAGAYFFRKSCTYISDLEEALMCFASVNGTSDNEAFIHGFKQAVAAICLKNSGHGFHYLVVEDVSDNDIIITNLKQKTWPEFSIPAAYFFYNYAYPTFPAKKVLIIS